MKPNLLRHTGEARIARHARNTAFHREPFAHVGHGPSANSLALLAELQGGGRKLEPTNLDVTQNPLRPATLDAMIGQSKLKPLMRRLIDSALARGVPLDHLLLVGASGTGKSTLAMIVARELHTDCFMLKCPVDMETLLALRESASDGAVCFLDELHQQVQGDRRGLTQSVDPENLFHVLEDRVINTPTGPLAFPHICFIGATTDVGMLPEPLVNRFPIQPRLAPYTNEDMAAIARYNAQNLNLTLELGVDSMLGGASRGVPRQVNSYIRSAAALGGSEITRETAREVVEDLAGTSLDGLDPSMQLILKHLYRNGRKETRNGVTYRSSVGALATAAGHGRDVKIMYFKEAYLIERGLLSVETGGRTLTPAGVERAKELCA